VTRDDRIDLEFKNITLSIGPFKAAEKVSHEAGGGMIMMQVFQLQVPTWHEHLTSG
jgi:hypothetical protein